MRRLLLVPIFLLALSLTGCSTQAAAQRHVQTPAQPPEQTVAQLASLSEKEAIETLVLEFAKQYYTFNYCTYLEDGLKLTPYLTKDYVDEYTDRLSKSLAAIQAVKASSYLQVAQIILIEKSSPTTVKAKYQFKAKVTNNGKETESRYSSTIKLRKVDEKWLIEQIEPEQPVEFINISSLL